MNHISMNVEDLYHVHLTSFTLLLLVLLRQQQFYIYIRISKDNFTTFMGYGRC